MKSKKGKRQMAMRNKIGKKWVLLIAMVLAIGALASGCSAGSGSSDSEGNTQEGSGSDGMAGQIILKDFEAETLEGGVFTQTDLAAKDVTIFNFWSVLCGPCIEEMPDIAVFEKSLPDNVGLVTVCLDGSTSAETAKQILSEAGYEGVTLLNGSGDFQKCSDAVQYTPTTIVVDKEGNMIGKAIIGGQEDLDKAFTEAVNAALKSMGKAEMSRAGN